MLHNGKFVFNKGILAQYELGRLIFCNSKNFAENDI